MQVPALLKAKVTTDDNLIIEKVVTAKTGYMVVSEFEDKLGFISTQVFPTKSAAVAYASGSQIIEVEVIRK